MLLQLPNSFYSDKKTGLPVPRQHLWPIYRVLIRPVHGPENLGPRPWALNFRLGPVRTDSKKPGRKFFQKCFRGKIVKARSTLDAALYCWRFECLAEKRGNLKCWLYKQCVVSYSQRPAASDLTRLTTFYLSPYL